MTQERFFWFSSRKDRKTKKRAKDKKAEIQKREQKAKRQKKREIDRQNNR